MRVYDFQQRHEGNLVEREWSFFNNQCWNNYIATYNNNNLDPHLITYKNELKMDYTYKFKLLEANLKKKVKDFLRYLTLKALSIKAQIVLPPKLLFFQRHD